MRSFSVQQISNTSLDYKFFPGVSNIGTRDWYFVIFLYSISLTLALFLSLSRILKLQLYLFHLHCARTYWTEFGLVYVFSVLVCWFFSIICVKSWRFSFGLNIEEITSFSTHLFLLSLLSQRLQCNIRFILYIITSRFHAFVYCVSAAAAKRPFVSVLGGGLSMDWLGVFVLWMYRSWVACVFVCMSLLC